MLTIGTGIGGGLILDGEIYRGSIGAGAELGHIVVQEDGPPCQGNCPNHGCVETLASGTAIAREGKKAAEREPDSALGKALAEGPIVGKTVTELAIKGDPLAREVVAEAGRHLGVALASLANIFDPDVIVIGGGVSAVGDLMLDPGARGAAGARAAADEPHPGAAGRARARGGDDRSGGDGSDRARQGELSDAGQARRLPDPDREPRGHHPAGAARPVRGRRDRLRGHPPDRAAAGAPRDPGPAADLLPRGERGGARPGAGPADRARRQRRPRLRRRHPGDLRPRLPADPGLHRPRPRHRGAPGSLRRSSPRWSPRACRRTASASRASCPGGRASSSASSSPPRR